MQASRGAGREHGRVRHYRRQWPALRLARADADSIQGLSRRHCGQRADRPAEQSIRVVRRRAACGMCVRRDRWFAFFRRPSLAKEVNLLCGCLVGTRKANTGRSVEDDFDKPEPSLEGAPTLEALREAFARLPAPASSPLSEPGPRGLTVAVTRETGSRGGTIARRAGKNLHWQV